MTYYTYIIKSKIKNTHYIGSTSNLEQRIRLHNEGKTKSTKAYIPWEIVYYEEYNTKSEAIKREYVLKRIRNREVLLKIINKEI